jgi:hypothetical protein
MWMWSISDFAVLRDPTLNYRSPRLAVILWREQGPPKRWYPTSSLHGLTTQKTTWISFFTIIPPWGSKWKSRRMPPPPNLKCGFLSSPKPGGGDHIWKKWNCAAHFLKNFKINSHRSWNRVPAEYDSDAGELQDTSEHSGYKKNVRPVLQARMCIQYACKTECEIADAGRVAWMEFTFMSTATFGIVLTNGETFFLWCLRKLYGPTTLFTTGIKWKHGGEFVCVSVRIVSILLNEFRLNLILGAHIRFVGQILFSICIVSFSSTSRSRSSALSLLQGNSSCHLDFGLPTVFTTASWTALGLTQPPIQWVPWALSLGIKRQGREADHSPPSSAKIKECVELYLHSPNTPSWRSA